MLISELAHPFVKMWNILQYRGITLQFSEQCGRSLDIGSLAGGVLLRERQLGDPSGALAKNQTFNLNV